jgi:hypothetical protein
MMLASIHITIIAGTTALELLQTCDFTTPAFIAAVSGVLQPLSNQFETVVSWWRFFTVIKS